MLKKYDENNENTAFVTWRKVTSAFNLSNFTYITYNIFL